MKTKIFSRLIVAFCLLACTGVRGWAADDPGWPREFTTGDGSKLVIYQPQVDSWEGQRRIKARVAISVTPPQVDKPILGVVWVEADTDTIFATRTVVLNNTQIVRTSFPTLSQAEATKLTTKLKTLFPPGPQNFALDRVLANMSRTQEQARSAEISLTRLWPIRQREGGQ